MRVMAVSPGQEDLPRYTTRRLWIAVLALLGTIITGYLALYQIDAISDVWDPFFGVGSRQVLTSLEQLPGPNGPPIPDMILFGAGYLLASLLATAGGRSRWRTSPWIVALLGLIIYLLALAHLLLVLLQPVLFHAWSTLCLLSAVISFVMVVLVVPEVTAALRFIGRASEGIGDGWRVFWGIRS